MKRIVRLFEVSIVAIGVIWLVRARDRMRREGRSLADVAGRDLRGFVTHRFDPVVMRLGLAGGGGTPWAILEHVGRTSGTTYHTPIYARTTGDHAFIPLAYGTDVHWLRNVQAMGHCRIQLHDTIFELDEPAIVTASDNPMVPPALRETLELTGRTYLRLHVLDRAPGTFARRWPEPTTRVSMPEAPTIEIAHLTEVDSEEPVTA